MSELTIILTAAISLAAGLIIGIITGRRGLSASRLECARLQAAIEAERAGSASLLEAERENTRKMIDEIRKSAGEAAEERERAHASALAEMDRRFNEIVGKSTAQIRNAADAMLRESRREFAQQSGNDIGNILNPLKESIDRMKSAMEGNTLKQTQIDASLSATIRQMMEASRLTRESADNLARVFKGGSKVQGDWGEAILDELLQSQGFTPGIHYDIQETLRDSNGIMLRTSGGSRMRPDVILHLDPARDVIIDSKVSMSAYIDFINADNEADRNRAIHNHVTSVTNHVKELASKNYTSYVSPNKSIDYVIMFVPNSSALWLAFNAKPDLWRSAMEKNVFIADEQTLFAALKIIRMTWTQIAQARNHEKVYRLANEMLDRIGQFSKRFATIGENLRKAQEAYDLSLSKLQTGTQSIPATCAKLIKLGASESARNPLPPLPDITDETPDSLP